jgi:hypothetical protein
MSVYRFRVTFEEFEDVSRDIDIKADHSLQELQKAILESVNFDQIHGSAWFKSDDMWRKGKMLELIENSSDPASQEAFSKHTLARLITNPHQKFLLIYDLKEEWVFTIELVKILQADKKSVYPGISRKSGIPPKQYKIVVAPSDGDDDDEDEKPRKKAVKAAKPELKAPLPVKPVAEDDDDDEPDDDDITEDPVFTATADGYDQEEVNSLEGEEGEESEEGSNDDEYGSGDDDYQQDDESYGGYGQGGDDDERY